MASSWLSIPAFMKPQGKTEVAEARANAGGPAEPWAAGPAAEGAAPPAPQQQAADAWIVSVLHPIGQSSGSLSNLPQRCAACLSRSAHAIRTSLPVLKARPCILLVVLVATAVIAAVSGAGVVLAAAAEAHSRQIAAQGLAENVAAGLTTALLNSMAPVLAMSVFIRENPSVEHIKERFPTVSSELLGIGGMSGAVRLRMAPMGVVRLAAPLSVSQNLLGLDLLKDPLRRPAALEAIRRRSLTIQGPVPLAQEGLSAGLVVRLPIWISNVTNPNETFGAEDRLHDCPVCYNAVDNSRFWGFCAAVVNFNHIAGGSGIGGGEVSESRPRGDPGLLGLLEQQGYAYVLTATQPGGGVVTISTTAKITTGPVVATIRTPTDELWELRLAPTGGWMPAWRDALLAMVLVISVAIGTLLLALLVNRQQQAWLLTELRSSNVALNHEKLRINALLSRQYHLIACLMEQNDGKGLGALLPRGMPDGDAAAAAAAAVAASDALGNVMQESLDTAGTALERIEGVRRTITGPASITAKELQLVKLLGEGGFGRVYKGLWHGSTVAVKTMILPAKMSGAEKRERMAIMEAAISAAMQHPNIIRTFTYIIKPMAHTHAEAPSTSEPAPNALLGSSSAGTSLSSEEGKELTLNTPSNSRVLNFEVSLVLEYAELGSLRDALNAGAFRLPEAAAAAAAANGGRAAGGGSGGAVDDLAGWVDPGLNYAAVLDIAADVARAMVHLHRQQIIHSDLKARNVLLKADPRRGSGAVAKVADFGLALQIQSQDTHVSAWQGTPSYMAPEVQIYGRVSKAADVYSFGILMWELYTGGHAFKGTPAALLAYKVAARGLRPGFPDATPIEYKGLALACWATRPSERPTMEQVLESLVQMRNKFVGATPRINPYEPGACRDPARDAPVADDAGGDAHTTGSETGSDAEGGSDAANRDGRGGRGAREGGGSVVIDETLAMQLPVRRDGLRKGPGGAAQPQGKPQAAGKNGGGGENARRGVALEQMQQRQQDGGMGSSKDPHERDGAVHITIAEPPSHANTFDTGTSSISAPLGEADPEGVGPSDVEPGPRYRNLHTPPPMRLHGTSL